MIAALYIPVAAGAANLDAKIGFGFTAVLIASACYFHVKHLFIPDVDYGVVRCQRGYNGLALCMGIVSMLEMIALNLSVQWLLLASGVVLCAVSLAITPVMDRGVKKWTA